MKERESTINEGNGSRTERGERHAVYTEKHGFVTVRYPPGLSQKDVIRVTVGELPGGELIVNLYTDPAYGYACNVTYPELSEWGCLPE